MNMHGCSIACFTVHVRQPWSLHELAAAGPWNLEPKLVPATVWLQDIKPHDNHVTKQVQSNSRLGADNGGN